MNNLDSATATQTQDHTLPKVEKFVSGMKDQAATIKSKYMDKAWGATCDYVKENPGRSLLMAIATGWVLGLALRRR